MEIFPGDQGIAAHPTGWCFLGELSVVMGLVFQHWEHNLISASQMTGVSMLISHIKAHNNPKD